MPRFYLLHIPLYILFSRLGPKLLSSPERSHLYRATTGRATFHSSSDTLSVATRGGSKQSIMDPDEDSRDEDTWGAIEDTWDEVGLDADSRKWPDAEDYWPRRLLHIPTMISHEDSGNGAYNSSH